MSASNVFPFGPPISEVEQMSPSEIAFRQQQAQRKNTKTWTRNTPANAPSQHVQNYPRPRVYEQFREEDARSSTRSRRASVSGDEQMIGSFEDRAHDRLFHRQYQKTSKEEPVRWKAASKGDMASKRGNQDNDYHGGSYGSPELASAEHLQFQMTHHLKLKQNDVDVEHERLYTHDSSLNDEPFFPFQNYAASSPFEHGRTSRAGSAIDKDDIPSRFTDPECTYSGVDLSMTQLSRSMENYKKGPPPGVTKTMLEPRCRTEKNYSKISLEHRGKYFNEHSVNIGKFVESSSFGTRMDPMKLIASVHESSEQLPIINERKFSDVLNDKERELAASSLRDLSDELSVIQDPSLDESSAMNYAFRTEKSSENLQ